MRLLRADEVAERLGLKVATVRKMIYKGELPIVRPTKRAVRVREDDLDAIVRRGYQPARRGQDVSARPSATMR